MIDTLKRLFGIQDKPNVRILNHPNKLRVGDIIKFRFLDQSELSSNTFEVAKINTYIYGQLCYPELVLKDRSNNLVYMMVEEEDGDEYIGLSVKVPKSQMNTLLTNEQVSQLIDGKNGTKLHLTSFPETYQNWLAKKYSKVDHKIKGSFLNGDARYVSDSELQRQEPFIAYLAEDSQEEFCLELEVYESGEQELSITVYHEIEAIEEMWPCTTSSVEEPA